MVYTGIPIMICWTNAFTYLENVLSISHQMKLPSHWIIYRPIRPKIGIFQKHWFEAVKLC